MYIHNDVLDLNTQTSKVIHFIIEIVKVKAIEKYRRVSSHYYYYH